MNASKKTAVASKTTKSKAPPLTEREHAANKWRGRIVHRPWGTPESHVRFASDMLDCVREEVEELWADVEYLRMPKDTRSTEPRTPNHSRASVFAALHALRAIATELENAQQAIRDSQETAPPAQR